MTSAITTISLQSGSNGNCIYVEAGGVRLLFDAGLSGSQAEGRLRAHKRDIRDVDAVIISHDHSDHVRCAGVYQRRFGLPIFITPGTLRAAEHRMGCVDDVSTFRSGETLGFGKVKVETIPTPHDGVDGVVFVVSCGRRRLGILTDLGHVFPDLEEIVPSLDGMFIESNYDPEMLENGPYPPDLQDRIRGPGGHLSNIESAELLGAHAGEKLQWVCIAHLSENNNKPVLAQRTHRSIWAEGFPLHVADRYSATPAFHL